MTQSPEHIEDDIERIRARIDAKLNRLGNEISPAHMLKSMVGGSGGSPGELLGAVASKARENPLSTLLVGAGIAGFVLTGADRRRDNGLDDEHGYDAVPGHRPRSDDPAERIAQGVDALKGQAEDLRDGIAETAQEARSQLAAGAQSAKTRAEQTGASLKKAALDNIHAVEETVSDARAKAGRMARDGVTSAGHYVGGQMHRTRERTDAATSWVKDNPVPAGLMALALGAAAASFLTARKGGDDGHAPHNRTEHEPAESTMDAGEPKPVTDDPQDAAPAVKAATARPRKRVAAKASASKAKPASAARSKSKAKSKAAGGGDRPGPAAPAAKSPSRTATVGGQSGD